MADKSSIPPAHPKGNDKAGGGSQKPGAQQGRKIPGDGNNALPEDMPDKSKR